MICGNCGYRVRPLAHVEGHEWEHIDGPQPQGVWCMQELDMSKPPWKPTTQAEPELEQAVLL